MGVHPMGSRDTFVRSASGVIEKIQRLVDIQRSAKKRYCVRTKSVVVCVELSEHLVFHATQLSNGSKKVAKLPPLSEMLVSPDSNDPESTVMDLDELWSFVFKKANKVWIWIALCRKIRQVVVYAIGDQSAKTYLIL